VTEFGQTVPVSRSLHRDALALAAGMIVANASNYAFTLVMAFLLGPEVYGALGALLALVLVGSVPGLALQAVVARRTALADASRADPEPTSWPEAVRLVTRTGLGLALLTALAGPGLVLFLHLDSAVPVLWLALALAPTPLLFAVQGLLQGRERFGALAAVMTAGAAVKLATGVALVVAGFGLSGALAGVALGGILAALAGLGLVRPRPPAPAPAPGGETPAGSVLWREVGVATGGLLGLFLLANLDVLLARHYLDEAASGRYALGAVVAKIAFWAPQFVVTLIFTRLVVATDLRRLLARSAQMIAGFGGLLAAGLFAADQLGLAVPVLGQGYAGVGPLLPLFAALGTGLALVQLLLFEGIATHDRRMGTAVAVALAAELLLVAGPLHGSVAQVAWAAAAVVAGLAGTGWWLVRRRLARQPTLVPVR
jgi:O-antigen/teichoic acid export membrane protein